MSSQEAITQFVTLFVVIDPAAPIAMFLVTVRGLTRTQARLVAVIAAVIAFVVLLLSIAVTNGVTAIKLVFGLD